MLKNIHHHFLVIILFLGSMSVTHKRGNITHQVKNINKKNKKVTYHINLH